MKTAFLFVLAIFSLCCANADVITAMDGRNASQDNYMNDDINFDIDAKSSRGYVSTEREGIPSKERAVGIRGYNLLSGKYKDVLLETMNTFTGEYYNPAWSYSITFKPDFKAVFANEDKTRDGKYTLSGKEIVVTFDDGEKMKFKLVNEDRMIEKKNRITFMRKEEAQLDNLQNTGSAAKTTQVTAIN